LLDPGTPMPHECKLSTSIKGIVGNKLKEESLHKQTVYLICIYKRRCPEP